MFWQGNEWQKDNVYHTKTLDKLLTKNLTLDGIDFQLKYRDVSNDCLSFAGCHLQKPKMSAQAYSDKLKKNLYNLWDFERETAFHRNVTFQ